MSNGSDFSNQKEKNEEVWDWCKKNQVHVLFPHDFPEKLKRIYHPPKVLFVRGNVQLLHSPALAIVGARKASSYGLACAFHFSKEIAAQGWTIISGLARGIDGYAHRGALKARAGTIAVLGSGFKKIYPREHSRLAQEILEKGGAWISEYYPDEPALPRHFPERNRLIAGLAMGTLVIEARQRSGSLITALNALDEGRELFVVPGQIDQQQFDGSHHLIQQGAKLVYRVRDVLEEWGSNLNKSEKRKEIPLSFGEAFDLKSWISLIRDEPYQKLKLAIESGSVIQTGHHQFICTEKESP